MNAIVTVEVYKNRKAEDIENTKNAKETRRKHRYEFDGKSYSRLIGCRKRCKKEDNGEFTQYKGNGNISDYKYVEDDDCDRAKLTREIYHKELKRRENKADMAYGNLAYGPALVPSKFSNKRSELRSAFIIARNNRNNLAINSMEARDAINRHIRRHPKQYKYVRKDLV